MSKGQSYTSERAVYTDPRSDCVITRLTHGPTIAQNLYFEMDSFTPDEAYAVFIAQRYAGRNAPWDLFRARTDGLELVQLTEWDDLSGIVFCPARNAFYFQSRNTLFRMDLFSLEEEAVTDLPAGPCREAYSLAAVDPKGIHYYSAIPQPTGTMRLIRVDTADGHVTVLHESEGLNHVHVDPRDRFVHFNDFAFAEGGSTVIGTDGSGLRRTPYRAFAHHTWYKDTGKMQGTLLPPGKALALRGETEGDFTILAEGRSYWHSSASADGTWIVSDTNWPQEGLYLLHVPTGKVSFIHDPGTRPSHPQWTHPHPTLSPALRYVLFNSDATGVGQVYLAELSDAFLAQARGEGPA